MSRRFGRNQRRRMRQDLTNAQQAYQMANGLLQSNSQKLARAMETIDEAKRALSPYSAALPAVNLDMGCASRDRIDLPRMGEMSQFPFDDDFVAPTSVRIDRLRVMLSHVERDRADASTHVRVLFGDGTWGYAISDRAIMDLPEDLLIKRISQELARCIARDLRNSKQR